MEGIATTRVRKVKGSSDFQVNLTSHSGTFTGFSLGKPLDFLALQDEAAELANLIDWNLPIDRKKFSKKLLVEVDRLLDTIEVWN